MEGYSHSLSGATVGLAASVFLRLPPVAAAELTGFTTGMALLPDLDCVSSCAARSLGFLSYATAFVIRFIARGHRHASHTAIGIAGFTLLAIAACHYRHDDAGRAGLALLVALTVAGAAEALHLVRGHAGDVVGIAAAAAVVFYGQGLAWIPLAVALGCATHVAGDSLTESGCMWAWPLSSHRFHLLPGRLAFTTGTRPETLVVDPLLGLAFVVLAARGITVAVDPAAWASLSHFV